MIGGTPTPGSWSVFVVGLMAVIAIYISFNRRPTKFYLVTPGMQKDNSKVISSSIEMVAKKSQQSFLDQVTMESDVSIKQIETLIQSDKVSPVSNGKIQMIRYFICYVDGV